MGEAASITSAALERSPFNRRRLEAGERDIEDEDLWCWYLFGCGEENEARRRSGAHMILVEVAAPLK